MGDCPYCLCTIAVALLVPSLVFFYVWFVRGRGDIKARDKPILVTGAASGFGLELTRILLRRGCFVYAADVNETRLMDLYGKHSQVLPIRCDISNSADVAALAQCIEAHGKGLYGIVNNAGVAPVPHSLVETPENDMLRTVNINLLGMWKVTKACWPTLKRWGPGSVVINITSCAGLISAPYMGPYTMSKFGAESFTDCLRRELRPYGVRVAAIEPYFADTNILNVISTAPQPAPGSEPSADADSVRRSVGFIKRLRLLTPERVAEVIAGELFSSNIYTRQIIAFPWDYVVFKLGWISMHVTDSLADWIMVDLARTAARYLGGGRRRRNASDNSTTIKAAKSAKKSE